MGSPQVTAAATKAALTTNILREKAKDLPFTSAAKKVSGFFREHGDKILFALGIALFAAFIGTCAGAPNTSHFNNIETGLGAGTATALIGAVGYYTYKHASSAPETAVAAYPGIEQSPEERALLESQRSQR